MNRKTLNRADILASIVLAIMQDEETATKRPAQLFLEFYDEGTGDLIAKKAWPTIPVPGFGDKVVLSEEKPTLWLILRRSYFFRPDDVVVVEYTVREASA